MENCYFAIHATAVESSGSEDRLCKELLRTDVRASPTIALTSSFAIQHDCYNSIFVPISIRLLMGADDMRGKGSTERDAGRSLRFVEDSISSLSTSASLCSATADG